jgi:arylsulfatase A-like enzyme
LSDRAANLVLVSIDALRFDGPSGEPDARYLSRVDPSLPARRRTPRWDAFAAGGTWFSCLVSSAPYTTNAHATLLTGTWPWVHGARSLTADTPIPSAVPLLAEVLRDRGFATMSASAMPHFFHTPSLGLDRGFDERVNLETHLLGRERGRVADWLAARRGGRFFLFYHTAVVHDYLTADALPPGGAVTDAEAFYRGLRSARDRPLPERLARYSDAVNRFDGDELAWLLDSLKGLGLLDSTLVVLLGDHGEPHPSGLGEEEVRVPAVFRGPGVPAGVRVAAPVPMMDVMPTALELLGVPAPDGLPSRSLSPFWSRPDVPARDAYMEMFTGPAGGSLAGAGALLKRGLRRDGRKLVREYPSGRWLGRDLARDWAEAGPAEDGGAAAWEPLRRRLEEIEGQDRPAVPAGVPSDDVVRRLRELGYLD